MIFAKFFEFKFSKRCIFKYLDLPDSFVDLLLEKSNWTRADFLRGYIKKPLTLVNNITDENSWPCVGLHMEIALLQGIATYLPQYSKYDDVFVFIY